MKYCHKCRQEIPVDASHCPHCGTAQISNHPSATTGRKGVHCPECGSTHLSTMVETSTNGGTAVHTPLTSRVGVSTYTTSNTHRNYWICHNCGQKFRNLQNLKEEIARETKRMKLSLIWFIICTIAGILIFSSEFLRFFAGFAGFGFVISGILFFALWLSTRKKVTDMSHEREYLEKNCFD